MPEFDQKKNAKANKKLPKAVIMMIEKNNLVMAIKTLAQEENISLEDAKARVDAYEDALQEKQELNLAKIANRQGIPDELIDQSNDPDAQEENGVLIKNYVKSDQPTGFAALQSGLNRQLHDMEYKKPLLPYWAKRVAILVIIMVGLFWILWRVFGK
ncbi:MULTISPECIES: hypothetical protein [Psychrobacter]|uniref:hypothetical protein n=1 Tax=Psychrobacter TaxID=497 RepID=UPI00146DBB2D|nr:MULTISPECIES: hypothetical protein [Psychrobacter]